MTKPTVYLDTNIISAYWYSGVDVDGLARRGRTRDWWQHERGNFSVSVSAASEDELAAGKFRRQADCLRFARKLSFLTIDAKTRDFSATLVERGVVPAEKPGDALHMAVCAVHGIDYLLSWNYAHLVNPIAQVKLEMVCRQLLFRAPLLVSPESIPKANLGQVLRRPTS
jgi:predicted nucleic acid-binding protein